ncbi:MAG TPA: IclR family transcriptional regulator [Peptococcaceae bacterium]|nr:IclR family transcriptional regulator [Peptococcaceae bacterium]
MAEYAKAPCAEKEEEKSIKSIERAIEIIYFLSEGERGLVEIANHFQLSKATAHRLLSSLKATGLVSQNNVTKRYMVGHGIYRLLNNLFSSNNSALITLSRNSMYRLKEISGETISIHIPYGGSRLCVSEIKSDKEIIYTAGIGAIAPIYLGAAGKALLAFMPENKRKQILKKFTNVPNLNQELLTKQLEQIAENRYALSFGERIYGSACLAVPILIKEEAIAALCILGPSFRLTKADLERMIPHIQHEANLIEQALRAD